ncbi:hypothetical protein POX_b03391 [Penicillium oxalicum]|uniref:hypothetical protein n=1 Tax=Penicillium oxalicum TaxID=69781 RepID=UPI0020B8B790|nr:hypothetical protein POX_b03391 [Penicillium oxalicum]KAI2793337.1 hypothetical protein POX_b03391 [Penicillium oxalicum]
MPSLRSRSDSGFGQLIDSQVTKNFGGQGFIATVAAQLGESLIGPGETFARSTQNGRRNLVNTSRPSAANAAPTEILHQVYSLLSPHDFDNARRTCSQWMKASLNRRLLEGTLKCAGWWDAFQRDMEKQRDDRFESVQESDVWKMSKRLATECLLSGHRTTLEKSGFIKSEIIHFSGLFRDSIKTRRGTSLSVAKPATRDGCNKFSTFNVSSCGKYVLVTGGCIIYLFRLLNKGNDVSVLSELGSQNLELVSQIDCTSDVLLATMDTSTPRVAVAALLENRVGMVYDVDPSARPDTSHSRSKSPKAWRTHTGPHFYQDICSEDHPPRTIAILPGRRCVAFGCAGGVEIHWSDEKTGQDRYRRLPMSQPSETLHFLPSSQEDPAEFRLISSLAGPGPHECSCRQFPMSGHSQACPFHILSAKHSLGGLNQYGASSLNLVRATHCHNYRAVPINDGLHMAFVDPRTGNLCIGSNSPIGGPTSLTRAFVCVPPCGKNSTGNAKEFNAPIAFTVGSDLSWGLRIVAAYEDRIVLYSIPSDIFNVIRREREHQSGDFMGDGEIARDWLLDSGRMRKRCDSLAQDQRGGWECALSVSYRSTSMTWPFKVHGKEIGRVDDVVELALQTSDGGARIWAFAASGQAHVFDIDTISPMARTKTKQPLRAVMVGSDGQFISPPVLDNTHLEASKQLRGSRKRKLAESRDRFIGQYGKTRFASSINTGAAGLASQMAAGPTQDEDMSLKRSSFAACIVDFKIPGLSLRDGPWGV